MTKVFWGGVEYAAEVLYAMPLCAIQAGWLTRFLPRYEFAEWERN